MCSCIYKLKNAIVSDLILVAFDPDFPVIVTYDGSPVAIDAVLSHVIGNMERPIEVLNIGGAQL